MAIRPKAAPRTKLVNNRGAQIQLHQQQVPPVAASVGETSREPIQPEWGELLGVIRHFLEIDSLVSQSPALPEQEEAARKYLDRKTPLYYRHVPLKQLLKNSNCDPLAEKLTKVNNALEKLFQYSANLLSPNRPRVWRSIKFSTPFFHHNINPVAGAKDILRAMGYSKDTGRTLEFETDRPDVDKVVEISAELLVATQEIAKISAKGCLPLEYYDGNEAAAKPSSFGGDGSGLNTTFNMYESENSIIPSQMGSSPQLPRQPARQPQPRQPDPLEYQSSPHQEPPPSTNKQKRLESTAPASEPPIASSSDAPGKVSMRWGIPESYNPPRGSSSSVKPSSRGSAGDRVGVEDSDTESDEDLKEVQRARRERQKRQSEEFPRISGPISAEIEPTPKLDPVPEKKGRGKSGASSAPIDSSEEFEDALSTPLIRPTRSEPEGQPESIRASLRPRTPAEPGFEGPGHDSGGSPGGGKKGGRGPPSPTPRPEAGASGGGAQRRPSPHSSEDMSLGDYVSPKDMTTVAYKKQKEKEFLERNRKKQLEEEEKTRYDEGYFFMSWIKECVKYGYEPEDVEEAVNKYRSSQHRTPLEYLQFEWEDLKRRVQSRVTDQRYVGKPSLLEARDCLLEAGGSPGAATALCIEKRKRKIDEFLAQYPAVSVEEAAEYLTRYKLNVEIAVSTLQFDKLQAVVEFIWDDVAQGEPQELMQKEDQRLCELIQENRERNTQYCYHILMGEYRLEDENRAELVLQLMEDKTDFRRCIILAQNCRDMEEVERYRNQECSICTDSYCMDEMVTMLHCTCSACKECFKSQYTLVAKEKNIAAFNCLVCDKPDLAANDVDRDDYLTLFANLLKEHLDPEYYQLFQKKSTEFHLSKDDNFRWCAHCGCGFIHDRPANRRIGCPHCKKDMCFYCKKPWEDQHRGVSCKDFTRWKAENDEGNQQMGLAAFLKENGIECPTCKYRYDLAKGGCLHFKCGQCSTEFCGGCGGVFDKKCQRFTACPNMGFHAHHPRDCLFYLRDWEVERLQKVLQDKDTAFDTEPPQKQVNAAVEKEPGEEEEEEKEEEEEQEVGAEDVGPLAVAGAENGLRCRVMLQKEVGNQKVDEECGEKCSPGHAGLCMKHYKEYLVCRINEASIDPAEFMEEGELRATLMRDEKPVPEKNAGESDGDFLKRLVEHLKRELELKKHEE